MKNFILKTVFFSMFAAIFLFGCKDDAVVSPATVTVSGIPDDGFSFLYFEEIQQVFTVTSDAPWEISKSDGWFTVSPVKGSAGTSEVRVSVTSNKGIERKGQISITADNGMQSKPTKQTFAVSQSGFLSAGISISGLITEEITFNAYNPGTLSFDVLASFTWSIALSETWVTVSPQNGNGGETVTVTVAPQSNNTTEPRECTLIIQSSDPQNPLNVATKALTLRQEPGNDTGLNAASGMVWTVASINQYIQQEWSDYIVADGKGKVAAGTINNFDATGTFGDYRGNHPYYRGYYYNWQYIVENQDALCPSPWRVPTGQDLIDLDLALNGSGKDNQNNSLLLSKYEALGFEYSGRVSTDFVYAGTWSYIYSVDEVSDDATKGVGMGLFLTNRAVHPYINNVSSAPKSHGFPVRCVKGEKTPIIVDGFPASWMLAFKSTVPGSPGTNEYYTNYAAVDGTAHVGLGQWWLKSDDGKSIFRSYRAATPDATQAWMSYSTYVQPGNTNQDRVIMYGLQQNDFWQMEIPTTGIAAGTSLKIDTHMQASGTGPGYFLFQYSSDYKTWTNINPKSDGDITYTVKMLNAATAPFSETFTIASAIPEGMFYIRLLVNSSTSANGGATLGTGGTSWITRPVYTGDSDKIPIMKVSKL